MAKAPPSFDCYVGDLLKSTVGMSPEVFGCYFRLLCYQWEHGSLPSYEDERRMVCGASEDRWSAIWARLYQRFEVDDNGQLYHSRMAEDRSAAVARWSRAVELSKVRKSAGSRGGASTMGRKQANAKANAQANLQANLKQIQANVEEGRGKGEGLTLSSKEGSAEGRDSDQYAPHREWNDEVRQWWGTWLRTWTARNRGVDPDPLLVSRWRTQLIGQPGREVEVLSFSIEKNNGRLEVSWALSAAGRDAGDKPKSRVGDVNADNVEEVKGEMQSFLEEVKKYEARRSS